MPIFMQTKAQSLAKELAQVVTANNEIVDESRVLEIIIELESAAVTTEDLRVTRLGRSINEIRRKTANVEISRRAKDLVKTWRGFVNSNKELSDKASESAEQTLINKSTPRTPPQKRGASLCCVNETPSLSQKGGREAVEDRRGQEHYEPIPKLRLVPNGVTGMWTSQFAPRDPPKPSRVVETGGSGEMKPESRVAEAMNARRGKCVVEGQSDQGDQAANNRPQIGLDTLGILARLNVNQTTIDNAYKVTMQDVLKRQKGLSTACSEDITIAQPQKRRHRKGGAPSVVSDGSEHGEMTPNKRKRIMMVNGKTCEPCLSTTSEDSCMSRDYLPGHNLVTTFKEEPYQTRLMPNKTEYGGVADSRDFRPKPGHLFPDPSIFSNCRTMVDFFNASQYSQKLAIEIESDAECEWEDGMLFHPPEPEVRLKESRKPIGSQNFVPFQETACKQCGIDSDNIDPKASLIRPTILGGIWDPYRRHILAQWEQEDHEQGRIESSSGDSVENAEQYGKAACLNDAKKSVVALALEQYSERIRPNVVNPTNWNTPKFVNGKRVGKRTILPFIPAIGRQCVPIDHVRARLKLELDCKFNIADMEAYLAALKLNQEGQPSPTADPCGSAPAVEINDGGYSGNVVSDCLPDKPDSSCGVASRKDGSSGLAESQPKCIVDLACPDDPSTLPTEQQEELTT